MANAFHVAALDSAALSQDVNQFIDGLTGALDWGTLASYPPTPTPAAPTAAASTASGVLTGAYQYAITYATGQQLPDGTLLLSGHQSAGSPASVAANPSAEQVDLSGLAIGPAGVVARDLYRTTAGGTTLYYLATVSDDTSTTWTDNTPDSALGTATLPTTNTTGTRIQVAVYDTVPATPAPAGTLVAVQPSGQAATLYAGDGTAWQPVGSTSAATTAALGLVEISAAPASGDPVAVTTTDPAYTALHGGTYVTAGAGLSATAGTDGQTLANTGILGVAAGHGVVVTLASQTATLAVNESTPYTWTDGQTFQAGLTTPTVTLTASASAATASGVLSQVGDQLYLGNGAAAVPVGRNPITNPLTYAALY